MKLGFPNGASERFLVFAEVHKVLKGNKLKTVTQIPSWVSPVAIATIQSASPAVH
jgi:hypothetical protein